MLPPIFCSTGNRWGVSKTDGPANRVGSFLYIYLFYLIFLPCLPSRSFPFLTAGTLKLKINQHTRSHPSAPTAELLRWRRGGAQRSAITVALKTFRYIKHCQAGLAGSVTLHLCFNAFFNSESLLIQWSKKEKRNNPMLIESTGL